MSRTKKKISPTHLANVFTININMLIMQISLYRWQLNVFTHFYNVKIFASPVGYVYVNYPGKTALILQQYSAAMINKLTSS